MPPPPVKLILYTVLVDERPFPTVSQTGFTTFHKGFQSWKSTVAEIE
jgi:hypothetical protein